MNDKPYRVLECPNYNEINADLIDYIEKYTDIITNDPNSKDYDPINNPATYPNFPEKFGHNIAHFARANPLLIKWFSTLGLVMRDAYFTLAWGSTSPESDESSCPIHLDKPPVYWKLNWPVMNMEQTAIRFFKLKDPTIDIQSLVRRSGDPESKNRDRYHLTYDDFVEFDRYRFDECKPVIMNGMIPHDVGFYENPVFPRVGFQAMFIKEPTHLL